jgi:glycosyltransferase involved in cell wall biosynthesis
MTIGIEAQRIFRKKKHGMDIVAIELIRNLQAADTQNKYVVFVKDDTDDHVIEETKNFRIVRIKGGPYPYWEQVLLPRAAAQHGVQLLHCTSNTAPLRIGIPTIVTVHDIIYLEKINLTKGSWYQRIGNLYRRWNVPRIVGKAARIITVSDFEKRRISEYFSGKKDKICTIYNGVGTHFHKVTAPDVLQSARVKYKLPEKYVFYLGNTDPKKNMEGVLKALSILRKRNELDFTLLMLDIDRDFLNNMAEKIGDVVILKHITFSGYVPNEELPAIYSLATAFLYPSLRESFGIPILEAMACGVPVVTSNTSSMPEVAGDAAVFADPFDPESIASSLKRVLDDDELRARLTERGYSRAARFTWKNNAVETLRLYSSVLQP